MDGQKQETWIGKVGKVFSVFRALTGVPKKTRDHHVTLPMVLDATSACPVIQRCIDLSKLGTAYSIQLLSI
jgi:hypothetical protein